MTTDQTQSEPILIRMSDVETRTPYWRRTMCRINENITNSGRDPYEFWRELNDDRMAKLIEAACETAYRRGFAQGFYACMECVEAGKSESFLQRAYARIYNWRIKRHKGKQVFPWWPARPLRKCPK